MNLGFHRLRLVIAALALVTERDSHHRALAYSGLLTITLYIVLLFARLA